MSQRFAEPVRRATLARSTSESRGGFVAARLPGGALGVPAGLRHGLVGDDQRLFRPQRHRLADLGRGDVARLDLRRRLPAAGRLRRGDRRRACSTRPGSPCERGPRPRVLGRGDLRLEPGHPGHLLQFRDVRLAVRHPVLAPGRRAARGHPGGCGPPGRRRHEGRDQREAAPRPRPAGLEPLHGEPAGRAGGGASSWSCTPTGRRTRATWPGSPRGASRCRSRRRCATRSGSSAGCLASAPATAWTCCTRRFTSACRGRAPARACSRCTTRSITFITAPQRRPWRRRWALGPVANRLDQWIGASPGRAGHHRQRARPGRPRRASSACPPSKSP